jgi:hypothetical protein
VQVAQAYSDAVRRGEYEAAEALLDPRVEVVPPSGRTYGLNGLKAAWAGPGFDHLEVTLEGREFADDGDDGAIMRGTQVYRWKENGLVAYTRPLRTRYDVSGDRIVRIEIQVE